MSGRHGREDLDAMERIPDALEVMADDPDAIADALDAADAARRRRGPRAAPRQRAGRHQGIGVGGEHGHDPTEDEAREP